MEEDDKKRVRSTLDDLIGHDLPDEVPGLHDGPSLTPVRDPNVETNNQALVRASDKAKGVMTNLLKFYLSEDIIEEQEYIKAKSQLDTYALSMLIRQMENSERAITLLMDTINEGDVAPRMFEVLSDLQRTLLDIIKSQTMYMVAVEENVKKISRDLDVYHGKSSTAKNKQDDKVSTRGTKDLMRALQDSLDEENIEDIDSDENEK
tara:strand:- start:466 stop:1083 length:618 start_codon:yes stop_codon:yes gene_type:complete